jgi:formamidopyrimidine-DNA glycosylase
MPELPDVEGFRRYFARHAKGKRIDGVDVVDASLLRNVSAQGLGRAVSGRRFGAPRRHGKWLLASAGKSTVLMHFGMTGRLSWGRDADGRHRHDRVVFRCTGGELRYRNMRKFGGVWLARAGEDPAEVMGPIGPDALELDWERFDELLRRRRGALKPALMDQKMIAGVGNLLADEVLWRARINPRTKVRALGKRRRRRLYDTLVEVTKECNRHGRIPSEEGWLTGVRDQRGASCPRCGTRLRRATIGGRTACWCPRCQRA